jgi:hypothetical protein
MWVRTLALSHPALVGLCEYEKSTNAILGVFEKRGSCATRRLCVGITDQPGPDEYHVLVRSPPICDGLGLQNISKAVSKLFMMTLTRNLFLRVQILEIAIAEPESPSSLTSAKKIFCVLVFTNVYTGFCIANVLHLTPPFSQANAPDASQSSQEGDHSMCSTT